MAHRSSGRQREGAKPDAHARQLEAVRAVSQEITRELDLMRLLELITCRATELVAGTSGGIYLWDEAAQLLSPHAYFGPSAERMRFPRRLGEGLTGHVAQERRGIIANDYRSSPYAHPRTLQSTTLTAAIVEPLLYRDRLLGVIAVHHEIAGSVFTEDDQKILRLFAPQAAIAIENARLVGALQAKLTEHQQAEADARQTRQMLQLVLDTAPQRVFWKDRASRFLGCNRSFAEDAGLDDPAEVIGKDDFAFSPPEQAEAYRADDRTVAETGAAKIGYEEPKRRPDGSVLWVQTSKVPLRDSQGRVVGVLGTYEDITKRKRVEEALHVRTRQLDTMNELTRRLSTILDPAQVVRQTLAAIQVLFPDCVAEYLELASDEERLRLVDIVGLRAGRELVRSEFRVKAGLVGLAAATRQPVTSPDVSQDPRFINKAWAAEEGVVSAIVLPLLHQDRLHGVLSVLMRSPYRFAQEEMDLVYSFAVHASIAIENAQLYEATRRRAEHFAILNDIARTLTTTLDPRQVAEQTLEAVRILIPNALARLWEHGPEEGLFRHVAGIGLTPRAGPEVVRFPPGEGLMGLALQTRRPVISPDVGSDSRFRERGRARADGVVSGLMLPLLSRDRVSGMLAIFTQTPHEFPPEELDLLNSFAAQAVVALENARLYDRLKQAYDEVQHAQEELVRSEKLRAVGQLGAGMAHDLNNVLAVILGQVELLKLRVTDPGIREGLSTLETAATDGADVVRRIQDFARPRGASPLVPVDLALLTTEALEITRPRWKDEPERRGVRIEVRSAIPALPPALGHAPEIREALINVIFNAVDAMPHGGLLALGGASDGREVSVTISDNGVGMPPEVRERIFEPFFTTKGPQGTGLGLSVVYGIMERHDGSIEVESQLGAGTTVHLRFQAAAEAPRQPSVAPGVPLPRTILLIDDDQVVRQTLGSLLRSAGHTVIEADSGAEGLARLGEARPDLVLTDLGMPEMTGREVAEAVKAAAPSLPVVLLTGWGDQVAETESALPVDRILGKPIRLNDLLAVIAELTGPTGA